MAERSLFSKLFNPTEEEKEEIIKGVKEGQKYLNILSEEGFSIFENRGIGAQHARSTSGI